MESSEVLNSLNFAPVSCVPYRNFAAQMSLRDRQRFTRRIFCARIDPRLEEIAAVPLSRGGLFTDHALKRDSGLQIALGSGRCAKNGRLRFQYPRSRRAN